MSMKSIRVNNQIAGNLCIEEALRGNRIIRPFKSETAQENSIEKLVADLKSSVKLEEVANDDVNPGMAIVVNNPLMLDR